MCSGRCCLEAWYSHHRARHTSSWPTLQVRPHFDRSSTHRCTEKMNLTKCGLRSYFLTRHRNFTTTVRISVIYLFPAVKCGEPADNSLKSSSRFGHKRVKRSQAVTAADSTTTSTLTLMNNPMSPPKAPVEKSRRHLHQLNAPHVTHSSR